MGLRAALLLLSLIWADAASAQDGLRIVSTERPPYMTERNGAANGVALDLALHVARRAGLEPAVRFMPFQRAVMQLELGGTLYPALLRTPQREARYAWIGRVHTDRAVFFTRIEDGAIDTVEQARELRSIGVLRGSELHPLLQSYGMETTVQVASTEEENLRLLRGRRIDAWFALHAVGHATAQEMSVPNTVFRTGASFAQLSFWLVASRDLSPVLLDALRQAYVQTQESGEFGRITKPLSMQHSPS